MQYTKINSLWKRQDWFLNEGGKKSIDYQNGRDSFIYGDYSEPEFSNIKRWSVEEKVDGTNIRVMYKFNKVFFGGRTDKAQIPHDLLEYLYATFTEEKMASVFPPTNIPENPDSCPSVVIFGEGYGPKIQSTGEHYRSDVGFISFDIHVNGWWLKREDVKDISDRLGIPMVPQLGIMTEEEIVDFVKSKPISRCSIYPQMMEGVIARPYPLMLFRNGKQIVWKLKCKEFQ